MADAAAGVARTIPEIRTAILAVIEDDLRSNELGRIANALGACAEALGHAIVYGAQGDADDVQGLLNTSARVVVTHARKLMAVTTPPGPTN